MTPPKPVRYAVYAGLTLIYILLRYWNLTASCLWFDELFSIHAAEHSWNSILDFVAQDLIHPPLFYVLLKFWLAIGGDGLLWVRVFPVVFAVLALVPFFLLCRELKLRFGAIALALLVFAVNGSLIKYSQEVRMYAPLLCLSLFSIWLFVRFLNTGKWIVLLALVNIAMVYTHYFGWLVIICELTAIALLKRERLLKAGLMTAGVFAAFVPWIVLILKAAPAGEKFAQNIGWMQRPDSIMLFQLILNLFEPLYYKASSAEFASNYFISLPLFVLIIFAGVYYFRKSGPSERGDRQNIYLLIVLIALPVLIAFIASWILPYSVWGTRHLIVVFVPFILLIARVVDILEISSIKIWAVTAFAAFSIIAFGVQLTRGTQQYIWCGWEVLARQVEAAQPGMDSTGPARVYVFEDLTAYHFWFALRKEEGKFQVEKLQGLEQITEDTAFFLPRGFDGVRKVNINDLEGDKFWIAFRAAKWDLLHSPLYDLISRGYKLGEPRVFEAGKDKAFLVAVEKENRTGGFGL
jgi:uncharacterized membrane protein